MADHGGEPDSFGLSPVQTLARVADPTPARQHSVFWSHWLGLVEAIEPKLVERKVGGTGLAEVDDSDGGCTHALESVGGVRIGCRLVLPPGGAPVTGGLVSTHGYAVSTPITERDRHFETVLNRGVAVLNVRLRGFAGSRLDTGDLQTPRGPGLGWMTVGLDHEDESPTAAMEWVYPQAVADLFQACRALRWLLEERVGGPVPISLHGESFGGGLAVPAAAKLEGRGMEKSRIDRLVLALPTLGDWPWRHDHPIRAGSGAEVQHLIDAKPGLADLIRTRLRLLDSVVHATKVRCPVLCKLAERDEVVPAPTAAAVFNALRVDPGLKWRFVVPHGHAETGLANARRHAEFELCAADFLDPAKNPTEVMTDWRDRLNAPAESEAGASGETGTLFEGGGSDDAEAAIARAYEHRGRTLDDLPYTEDFEQLWSELAKATRLDRRGLFHKLHNMRKAGRLPRVGRAKGSPPKIDTAEESRLAELVTGSVGTLGQRDRLPYTPEFDALLEAFNAETGRALGPHECWRLIAKLAK